MPKLSHLVTLLGVSLPGIVLGASLAVAATRTVHVDLLENNGGRMVMKTSAESVRAGKVVFEVTNKSHDIQHEFLIAPLKGTPEKVAYDEAKGVVKEETLKGLKELGDLDPGKSGKMTFDLKPGKYLLFCNMPGHYKAGMYHVLTVTK